MWSKISNDKARGKTPTTSRTTDIAYWDRHDKPREDSYNQKVEETVRANVEKNRKPDPEKY